MTATSLDEIAEFVNGGAWKQTEYAEEGSPVLQVSNISGDGFDVTDHKWLNTASSQKYAKNTLQAGDVIIATVGSHAQSDSAAGRAVVVDASVTGFLLNQNAVALRSKSENLNQSYLGYLCKSRDFQIYAKSAGKGAANQMRIGVGALKSYEFDLPDIDDQVHISSILLAYDDLIENNRRRIALLEEAARQLYKEWFVRFRFPGHEHAPIVDGVPEGWEGLPASEAMEINPKTVAEKGAPITYVPMSALSEFGMGADGTDFEIRTKHTSVRFKRFDTLFARITPCLENGKTGFVDFLDGDEIACGSTEFIILRGRRVSPFHTYLLARDEAFRGNAIKSMIGSSGRQRVQTNCFDRFIVPVPPNAISEQFNEAVGDAFQQIEVLSSQNQALARARDLLLPKLMSGEIAV